MYDSKLSDRQKKYNEKFQGNHSKDILLRRREEYNLSLRKDKVFNKIMERRLRGLNMSKMCDAQNLFLQNYENEFVEIDINKLDIAKSIINNYEQHSEKLIVISKFLEEKISEGPIDENLIKFAILKFRIYLQEKSDKLNQLELEIITDSIFPAIEKIFLQEFPSKLNLPDEEYLNLLKSSLQLKYEISWSLINLTNESGKFVSKVLNVNFLKFMEKIIYELLRFKSEQFLNTYPLLRHIIWLFSNVMAENQESNIIVRNTVNIVEIMKILSNFEIIKEMNKNFSLQSLILTVLWAIQNFMKYTESNTKHLYSNLLINVINILKICSVENEVNLEIFSEGIETLTYFSGVDDLVQFFIEHQCIPILANSFYLVTKRSQFDTYMDLNNICKIIGELFIGTDEQAKIIMSYPIFDKLLELLGTINSRNTSMIDESNEFYERDTSIVKHICMGLSNLCAGTQENIEKIILDNKIMDLLLSLYDKFNNRVRFEILHIFFNAFYIGMNHVKAEIVRHNIHKIFINMLNSTLEKEEPSVTILLLCLRAFKIFLEYGDRAGTKVNVIKIDIEEEGIINLIEKLQFHKKMEVYDLAHEILYKYWGDNEFTYSDYAEYL
jgi:hypothetical protein